MLQNEDAQQQSVVRKQSRAEGTRNGLYEIMKAMRIMRDRTASTEAMFGTLQTWVKLLETHGINVSVHPSSLPSFMGGVRPSSPSNLYEAPHNTPHKAFKVTRNSMWLAIHYHRRSDSVPQDFHRYPTIVTLTFSWLQSQVASTVVIQMEAGPQAWKSLMKKMMVR